MAQPPVVRHLGEPDLGDEGGPRPVHASPPLVAVDERRAVLLDLAQPPSRSSTSWSVKPPITNSCSATHLNFSQSYLYLFDLVPPGPVGRVRQLHPPLQAREARQAARNATISPSAMKSVSGCSSSAAISSGYVPFAPFGCARGACCGPGPVDPQVDRYLKSLHKL